MSFVEQLSIKGEIHNYYSLSKAAEKYGDISKLPFSLKVLLENLLRFEDGQSVTEADIQALVDWQKEKHSSHEIAYRPARVLMQDFTGVPAVVDLAAMRDAVTKLGGNAEKINPLSPVDLVIDHSVQVDRFGIKTAYIENTELEMQRNRERYEFLRWGQTAFNNFQVVPPGTGICHQVNLEYLAKSVWTGQHHGALTAYPDTLVGTDSHTTMINALGVLGWGVGGIEAEAAMLGQPVSMLIPEVIGFRLSGKLKEGITATDLVLTVTQMLRQHGVVGKFVEFFGPGLSALPLADRATIANMTPEFGATCGFFPIDKETLHYMRLTNRSEKTLALVEAYCKAQGLWHTEDCQEPAFTDTLALDLSTVEPSLAGPKRPQDKVNLSTLPEAFKQTIKGQALAAIFKTSEDFTLQHGAVVIAAITSCTNTSNPSVLMAAGLLAKKALEKGLVTQPWVKTSLAPGSKVVTEYLEKAGLQQYLDKLGFGLVGYGCTTCIGNSGPLPEPISRAIEQNNISVASVLSGNRNFEGRIHPLTKTNWLASPPLVVAYALAGTVNIDLSKEPIANGIYLKDIWPSNQEVADAVACVSQDMFASEYAQVFDGDATWQSLPVPQGKTYAWNSQSTYVQHPPFFEDLTPEISPIHPVKKANILVLLGDSITTDHISPAGAIKADSPAGEYLKANKVERKDFNSYGSRRGNHEVMMRGTFANIRIKNEMLPGTEGGVTKHIPTGESLSIYDAAMRYVADDIPLVVIAGKEYGTGSSRDWAAKGTRLLGVKAVIAESFERIHRSNLIGMGVLPLCFKNNDNRLTLGLDGSEQVNIAVDDSLSPRQDVKASITRQDGSTVEITLMARIDTQTELDYYKNGGILHYVIRNLI